METSEEEDRQLHSVLKEEQKDLDKTSSVRVHEDETKEVRTPGFSRMRTGWNSPEAAHMLSLRDTVDEIMLKTFPDALMIMMDIYDVVREPLVDPHTGEVKTTSSGFPIYRRNESGSYVEDYSLLGIKQRENFLFQITVNLVDWKQRAADLWGEAMFAKAAWEERFSDGFTSTQGKSTVDDKTNIARQSAVDERYFAIYQSWISRRADALTSSMELIAQRLKDTLAS